MSSRKKNKHTSYEDARASAAAKREQMERNQNAYLSSIQKEVDAGKLSRETFLEVSKLVDAFSPEDLNRKYIEPELSGTSNKGKSRLATQKLFEAMLDKPGRKQTMLAPRSNSSKGLLGV